MADKAFMKAGEGCLGSFLWEFVVGFMFFSGGFHEGRGVLGLVCFYFFFFSKGPGRFWGVWGAFLGVCFLFCFVFLEVS